MTQPDISAVATHICVIENSCNNDSLKATVASFAACAGVFAMSVFCRTGRGADVRSCLATDIATAAITVVELDGNSEGDFYAALFARMAMAAPGDLLLVSGGVVCADNCLEHLRRVAAWDDDVATTSPLSNTPAMFDLDLRSGAAGTPELEHINRLLFRLGRISRAGAPCFLPGCFYLRRHALAVAQQIMAADDSAETPWWWRLARGLVDAGFNHVMCDHVYVYNRSAGAELDTFMAGQPVVREFNSIHPFLALRHACADALQRGLPGDKLPWYDNSPVQLHIMHSWGGGLEHWVRDYCTADTGRINLVLQSVGTWGAFGQRLHLYASLAAGEPLRRWELPVAIAATATTNFAYRRILQSIVSSFGVGAVVVSSLIGHSLDVLATGLPTLVLGHDYYPFCPALNVCFDGLCRYCDADRLEKCFDGNEHNRFFRDVGARQWQLLRQRYLELLRRPEITMVAFTPALADNLRALDERFAAVRLTVIPHGMDVDLGAATVPPPGERKLRVLILGGLSPQKGGGLLRECYGQLLEFCDLYLLGCGNEGAEYSAVDGVTVISAYARTELQQQVDVIAPDVALLLSVCAETFSYTLSELRLMAVPVAATDIGAFADRISHDEDGFLFQPQAAALVACVRRLADEPERLEKVRKRLTAEERRSCAAMVADYHRLLPLAALSLNAMPQPPCYGEIPLGGSDFRSVAGSFPAYIHHQHNYLHGRIAATTMLRPWQKRLAAGALALAVKSLLLAYRLVYKLKTLRRSNR